MCGRITLFTEPASWGIEDLVNHLPGFRPRYNIAPSQYVPVIRRQAHELALVPMQWGFIPPWEKQDKPAFAPINARVESIASKPMFRGAVQHHRCLVPASGYYEWQVTRSGKRPWFIYPQRSPVILLAGIYSSWLHKDEQRDTFAIITRPAIPQLAPIHDRMPLMLAPEKRELWLGEDYASLFTGQPEEPMRCHPVNTRVNSPANDDDSLVIPAPGSPDA